MASIKRFLQRIILVIRSFCFTCFLMEIGLRAFYGNNPPFLYPQVRHVPAGYRHKFAPNQSDVYTLNKKVETNSFGFSDYDWEMPKPEGRVRIMIIGDSLTFGNGVLNDEAYWKYNRRKSDNAFGTFVQGCFA